MNSHAQSTDSGSGDLFQEPIPFSPPLIGEEEIAAVVATLKSDWITTGPETKRFEQLFAQFIGAQEAVALSSCTAGLHTALLACGIGPGDEVITTPMTFAATVNVIEHVGARPVLVDVEPDTLCISPIEAEKAITSQTKAILAVHYAGHPADMSSLERIAEDHSLFLIEDAAHALPAKYLGQTIGSSNRLTSFSFYATKNMTTAEGGMLTGDPELLDKVRVLGLHGMSRHAWNRYSAKGSWAYDVAAPGFKYNMTDIQAAIGIQQLSRLTDFQHRRLEVAQLYTRAFGQIESLQTPVTRAGVDHAWHLYVLRLRPELLQLDRNTMIEALKELGIGCSVHFIPIHIHSYYREKYGYREKDFPIAFSNYQRMLSLPLNPSLTDEQVNRVINSVAEICSNSKRVAA